MNIHVPQSLESQAEMKYLSAAQWNMISPQSSKPNMAIVQDSLLGAYRMTRNSVKLTSGQFFNIAMSLPRAPWAKNSETVEQTSKFVLFGVDSYRDEWSKSGPLNRVSTNGTMTSDEIMDRIQHIRRILKEKGKKQKTTRNKRK